MCRHARGQLSSLLNTLLSSSSHQKCSSPDEIFVLSRILYLCTVSPTSAGSFIRDLVEGNNMANSRGILDIVECKLDLLMAKILQSTKMSREAMTDILKLTFNLLLHYPNVRFYFTSFSPRLRCVRLLLMDCGSLSQILRAQEKRPSWGISGARNSIRMMFFGSTVAHI
jgi:hypothetical protein